jgi:hypothetical protein
LLAGSCESIKLEVDQQRRASCRATRTIERSHDAPEVHRGGAPLALDLLGFGHA